MGAARILPPVVAGDSPLADGASRQRELEQLRATLDSLRNPAGAVRLAVQMLAGPLRDATRSASAEQASQVAEVLGALETATAELTRLLAPLSGGGGNGAAEVIAMPTSPPLVERVIEGVRQAVQQRVRLPAAVETSIEAGARPSADAKDLQAALVGLVENAIESMARRRPDASPWTVELRVTLEPTEVLGDAMQVVFDVRDRGDGLPPGVRRWLEDPQGLNAQPAPAGPGMSLQLARRVAEDAGGSLKAARVGGTTRVRLCVPHR